MELYEALRTRRTATTFSDQPPPREAVQRIILAATWAPNHRLTQPWRFFVIGGDERDRFADAVTAAMDAKQADSTRVKLRRAPLVIVVAQHGTPDRPDVDLEDYAACACATENLLLAAHAEGLAGKWSTGELATSPEAFAYLGLAPTDRIVAYVYLGYADGQPAPRERAEPTITWRE